MLILLTARTPSTPAALICSISAVVSDVNVRFKPKVAGIPNNDTSVAISAGGNIVATLFKTDVIHASTIVNVALNLTRLLTIVADPFIPSFTDKVSQQMNLPFSEFDKYLDHKNGDFKFSTNLVPVGHTLGTPCVIFGIIDEDKCKSLRKKFG
jgi:hypothetical protein